MKRPLLAVGVSFALATWAGFVLGGNLLLLSGLCLTAGLGFHLARRSLRALPVILLSAALAFGFGAVYRQRAIAPLTQAAGREVPLVGVVTQASRHAPGYTLTVEAVFPGGELPGTALKLRGYGELEYRTGDGIACRVLLQELQGSASYWNARGVWVQGRVLESAPYTALSLPQAALQQTARLRKTMTDNLYQNLNPDTAGVMSAMALGEWGGINEAISTDLSRAGTVHLLSVSGLHLSILVGCVTALLEKLRRSARAVALGGMISALAFAGLVGFSPSITRALVMMLVTLAAKALSRRGDTLNSLGLALLLICLVAPQWTLRRGLWLSASSTAGIAAFAGPLQHKLLARYKNGGRVTRRLAEVFWGAAAVAASAYALSLPILLVTGGRVSLLAPLANVLVAPLAAPALTCGVVCALFSGVFAPFAWVSDGCTGLIIALSRLVAAVPGVGFSLNQFWLLVWLILFVTVGVVLLVWRRGDLLPLGACLLAVAFGAGSVSFALSDRDKLEVVALEGCSAGVLLRGGSAVVVGTPDAYDIGILMRYLDFRGIDALDAVVAWNCGEQMNSGLLRLVEAYEPAMVIGPDDAFILGQMARALPGSEILSGGYATVSVLGGARLEADKQGKRLEIRVGDNLVVQSGEEYAIIENAAHMGARGQMTWPAGTPPVWEPMGAALFGERRLILTIQRV